VAALTSVFSEGFRKDDYLRERLEDLTLYDATAGVAGDRRVAPVVM
jgi:hypothetical protein